LPYTLPSSGHVRLHRLWAFASFEGELTPTEHIHIIYCDECRIAFGVCLQSEKFSEALRVLKEDEGNADQRSEAS